MYRVAILSCLFLATVKSAPFPQDLNQPNQNQRLDSRRPQEGGDQDATILRYESENTGSNGYRYNVETSNGIQQEEQGEIIDLGNGNTTLTVRGQYSYTGPDGVVYTIIYVADENGFQPQGDHLPQIGATADGVGAQQRQGTDPRSGPEGRALGGERPRGPGPRQQGFQDRPEGPGPQGFGPPGVRPGGPGSPLPPQDGVRPGGPGAPLPPQDGVRPGGPGSPLPPQDFNN